MNDTKSENRAFRLLLFMSGLYFISFFQRVAVPGSVFNELQSTFSAAASDITALSTIYLMVYAGMQMFIGFLTDRHGGIRVILVSGVLLFVGSLLFPLSDHLWMLYLSRALVGLGASGMYLCIIKETDILFRPERFAPLLGLFCTIGYGGGLCGTRPFRALVDWIGWRPALLIPAVLVAVLLVITYRCGRPWLDALPSSDSGSVLLKVRKVMMNRRIYPLLMAVTINIAIYFSVQATIGSKFLCDFLEIEAGSATQYTFIMMLFTMVTMLTSGFVSRILGNLRKPFLVFASINTLCGVILLLVGIGFKANPAFFGIAFAMLAISGGITPVTVSFMKEINARDVSALSVGVQNTSSYLGVALGALLVGRILDIFAEHSRLTEGGVRIYPASAYSALFFVMLLFAAISVLSALLTREPKARPQPE
jgi:predicted MFS family arabinose efflux permease